MKNNFAQYIIDTNKSRSTKLALVDDTKSLTYGQMSTHIKNFGWVLRQRGVGPQDRVIISMEDCVEWPVAFLSILAVGGNPVLISADLPMPIMEKISHIADAKFVIGNNIPHLESFQKELILQTSDHECTDYYQYHPDEMCFWLLSSGTTGEPKCVVHRHQDLEKLLDIIAGPAYHVDEQSHILSTAKLSFTYGFNNSLTFGLGKGATVFLINGVPAPSRVFKILEQHKITHFFTVPTVINSMIKHGTNQKMSNTVKVMVSSGEPLPDSIARQFQDQHSVIVLDGLGMSECMYNYCTTTPTDHSFGTIGKPIPGIECSVRDEHGTELPPDVIGEMWVKHPCSALQYWKDWNKTKSTFIGEWIRTGDKVVQHKDGNYNYIARKDDLFKINGQYVSPIEIESAILDIEIISECAVVAKTGNQGLLEIHAFICADQPIEIKNLKQQLAHVLPSYKIPKHIHQIQSIPKTVTYKKTRSSLRSMLEISHG